MNNNTNNSNQSSDDNARKEREKDAKEFKKAADKSYKENENLKNRIFLGCLGFAGMMISAAAVQPGKIWNIYAAQTITVMLFVFGLHALAVAISLIALSNPEQPLWRWITCVWRWITCKKKDEHDTYTSYKCLINFAKYMDMLCLSTIVVWSLYLAWCILGESPLCS